jgi:hydroxymethylglutaryl-CoA lyase
MLNLPKEVRIVEVGPRDGLQNEKTIVPIEDKVKYVELLSEAGFKYIEANSFVRADKIPQMSDGKTLFNQLKNNPKLSQTELICLVPNVKGMEDALSVGVKHIAIFTATSNTFNKKNTNVTIDESLVRIEEVCKMARANNIKIRGYISTVFGCPYEGETSIDEFIRVGKILRDYGVYEISVGDTIGVANPLQVRNFLDIILKDFNKDFLSMHFHDTRGLATSNIMTSLEYGLANFDSSSGGLGGCPYAKGASGNVATEDIVNLFHSMGIKTGIDMEKLSIASQYILKSLNRESESRALKAFLGSKLSKS